MDVVEIAEKNDVLLKMCNRWIYLKIKRKEIADYLLKHNIYKIVVYGCGELGLRLMEDLSGTNIEVLVGLDKNASQIDAPVKVMLPVMDFVEKWENADAVIITPVYYYDEIYCQIRQLGYTKQILALNDILMDM